uniref:Uncharacterized protein n=1 Tax=Mycena chlorophos TaxID=658473 RepID=A0ABQ0LJ77_MYCCL|nr:predicted protein [Mycena chlorophos]
MAIPRQTPSLEEQNAFSDMPGRAAPQRTRNICMACLPATMCGSVFDIWRARSGIAAQPVGFASISRNAPHSASVVLRPQAEAVGNYLNKFELKDFVHLRSRALPVRH